MSFTRELCTLSYSALLELYVLSKAAVHALKQYLGYCFAPEILFRTMSKNTTVLLDLSTLTVPCDRRALGPIVV